MNDILYKISSVLPLETKSESIRRIHFSETLIEKYKENLNSDDIKKRICADALLYAIMKEGYVTAYAETVPTKENLERAINNQLPNFFGWKKRQSKI